VRIRARSALSRSRLGFRGAILLCLAVIHFGYGISLLFPSPEAARGSAYAWREQFLPNDVFGWLWVACAALLVAQAWSRHKKAGYAAVISLDLAWSWFAIVSTAAGAVLQGWVTSIIFAVFGAMAWIISLWPEPITSPTVATMKDDDRPSDGDA
jgi:hypothetical protein